jgi:outer membrane murein-binding lipoprotein Lpp
MPQQSVADTALVVIAVAVSVQTILMAGLCVSAFLAWRRVQTALSIASADLHARMDEIAEHVRSATGRVDAVASSVERLAEDAEAVAGGARRMASAVGGVVRTAVDTAATPPALLAVAGRLLLSRWARRSSRPALPVHQ